MGDINLVEGISKAQIIQAINNIKGICRIIINSLLIRHSKDKITIIHKANSNLSIILSSPINKQDKIKSQAIL